MKKYLLFCIILCSCSVSRYRSETSLQQQAAIKYGKILDYDYRKLNGTLYLFIDQWMGTPYKYGGTNKKGVDCSGFICQLEHQVYRRKFPRTAESMWSELGGETIKVKRKLKEGDLLFFRKNKRIFHVGIYLQNGNFAQASTSKGVCISSLYEPYWNQYFFRAKRL